MKKKAAPKKDFVQIAKAVVDSITGKYVDNNTTIAVKPSVKKKKK